jgi:hypothetical protein
MLLDVLSDTFPLQPLPQIPAAQILGKRRRAAILTTLETAFLAAILDTVRWIVVSSPEPGPIEMTL